MKGTLSAPILFAKSQNYLVNMKLSLQMKKQALLLNGKIYAPIKWAPVKSRPSLNFGHEQREFVIEWPLFSDQ